MICIVLTIVLMVSVAAAQAPERPYVPAPEPVSTGRYRVGVLMCNLWRSGPTSGHWDRILPFPERQPLLGWYDEGDPEVTDWEIKWLLDHGISYGVVCWYRKRDNLGKPIESVLSHWLHEGLFKSRYGDRFQFALLWENHNHISCGVASEEDLLENLLPYWIENYFKRENYLRIDGKPALYVYNVAGLISDLGGEEHTRSALIKVRRACEEAGLGGLTILGASHLNPAVNLDHFKAIGIDYVYAYHWPTFSGRLKSLDPASVIAAQEQCWREQAEHAPIPTTLTVSMGWDDRPWKKNGKKGWQLAPADFRTLCERARSYLDSLSAGTVQSEMVLIDNWNEFGEGHYIAPTREFGFGHLDAVRSVFAPEAGDHTDLTPEQVGLGPYDSLYRAAETNRERK